MLGLLWHEYDFLFQADYRVVIPTLLTIWIFILLNVCQKEEDATACCSQGKATCTARSKYVHGIRGFSTLESHNVTHFLWDTSLPTKLGLEPKIMDERESKNLKESTLCILHLWLPCFEFASGWKVTLGKINFGKSILFCIFSFWNMANDSIFVLYFYLVVVRVVY